MGGTSNPQISEHCPNCRVRGAPDYGAGYSEADDVILVNCDNENCAVDRFWGEPSPDHDKLRHGSAGDMHAKRRNA